MTRLISVFGGRSSQLGDSTIFIFDIESLHAVPQLPECYSQQTSSRRAVEAGLAERLQDRLALEAVEVGGKRLLDALGLRRLRLLLRLFLLFLGRNAVQGERFRAELLSGRERERALEDVFELAHVPGEVICHQLLERARREPWRRDPVLRREALQDVRRDERNVVTAF